MRRMLSNNPTPDWYRLVPFLALLVALAVPLRASAQLAAPTTESRVKSSNEMLEKLARRGDLTLREATLESALFTISELWGINIAAADVTGAVNGVFKDAPLRDILDSILLSNGYAYRPVGGSLVVSRMQDLGQINPFFVSETIPVGAAEVGEVMEAARLMSTPQGQVRALPSAGALLVVDFPDRVTKIRELVRQIDGTTRAMNSGGTTGVGPRQLEVAYFRTHYVPALQAATAIDVVLSTDGRIASVDKEDRLLVVDYPEHVRMVESVLARIDRPRPQVNIKALIYDISLGDLEQIGVNWDALSGGSIDGDGAVTFNGSGARGTSVTKTPFEAAASGGTFTFFSMNNNFNLQAVILALQQAEDSRLLADPNVTVMDNEAAAIQSVSEIPFQQLTQTGAGGNIGTTAFKEVGIKLDVTPKISRDGSIDLTVIPEFSRLAGFTPTDNQPIIDKRTATTRVRVRNGQTMMIAGLRQRSDVGDFDGVPLLKDVRFLGHLFRSRDTKITESELVVFITPEIVGYSDPLAERYRLSADTVECRLDMIPPAEGCPNCGNTGPCGCDPNAIVPHATSLSEVRPATAVPAATSLAPQGVEAYELNAMPPQPEAAPVDAIPAPVETIEPAEPLRGDDGTSASLGYPALSRQGVRRLPTTDGRQRQAVAVATRLAEPPPEQPLRVGYKSRYRAKGELYSDHDSEAASPPPEQPPKRSVRDWMFWR